MVSSVSPPEECVALPKAGDGVVYPLRKLIRHAGCGGSINDWKNSSLHVVQNFFSLILAFLNGV
jgi:hypothetical protein